MQAHGDVITNLPSGAWTPLPPCKTLPLLGTGMCPPPLHLHQATRGSSLPSPSAPILTRDRGHQCAQPLVLLLEGSADFPHVLQALGAKEKRPVQSCVGDNLPVPTSPFHPLPLFPQCRIWYLFRAGRCMLGGSQSVLGCLIWKTQGRAKLVIGTLC